MHIFPGSPLFFDYTTSFVLFPLETFPKESVDYG